MSFTGGDMVPPFVDIIAVDLALNPLRLYDSFGKALGGNHNRLRKTSSSLVFVEES
jgi:hypothetical protein